jgi:hypothetical protein
MRYAFPLLTAALFTAASAFAADLPKWKVREDTFSMWVDIDFVDQTGQAHHLNCRWEECGPASKAKTANLFILNKTASQPYEYSEHVWKVAPDSYDRSIAGRYFEAVRDYSKGLTTQASKDTYSTLVSKYTLDMTAKPPKAVIAGTKLAFPAHTPEASVSALGTILIVQPPTGVADDAPASDSPASPAKPAPKTRPIPIPKPGSSSAVALTDAEQGWLTPSERADYAAAEAKTPAPSAAERAALHKKTRAAVADNLRDAARPKYRALISTKIDPSKIDEMLNGVPHYSGEEVELSKADHDALAAVVKGAAGAGATLKYANAMLEYDAAMATVKGPKAALEDADHVAAHRVVVRFKAMVPVKPGTVVAPDAPPSRLSDADLAKLPKADQDAYNKDWDAAKTDDERRAVNKTYSDKIAAAKPADSPAGPVTPTDLSTIDTLPKFNMLGNDDKQKLCAPPAGGAVSTLPQEIQDACKKFHLDQFNLLAAEDKQRLCKGMAVTSGAAACGNVAANASSDMLACMKMPKGTPLQEKFRVECMDKANACKAPKTPAAAAPASALTPEIQKACQEFLAGMTPPNPVTGDYKAPPPPTGPGSGMENPDPNPAKKADPNFLTNVANGALFAIAGLILGSLLGGPLVMFAVAAAAGIGAYALGAYINKPKDKN